MINLHEAQSELAKNTARYKVWRAGRKTGKSVYATEELKGCAVLKDDARALYIATTQGQARDIVWRPLKKEFINAGAKTNESLLEIETPNKFGTKSLIKLTGWESIDRVRGQSFDLIIIDELDSISGFLQEFQETVKPLVLDRKGKIIFIGTPKDSNSNLQSLKDTYENDDEWDFFHSTSYENPYIDSKEIDKEKEALSLQSFRQEWLAEYGDGSTRLFDPIAVADMFKIELSDNDDIKYLTVDPAGAGKDTTAWAMWTGHEVWLSQDNGLRSDDIEDKILKSEVKHSIPRQNIAIDGVGLGDSIGDRATLGGITIFKGSFSPIKTDKDISKAIETPIKQLKYTESKFLNLRAQTYFALARAIQERTIKVNCSVEQAEMIKRELNATVEMEDTRKIQIIPKDEIQRIVGHSPDLADVLAIRMYWDIIGSVSPIQELPKELIQKLEMQFARTRSNRKANSSQ